MPCDAGHITIASNGLARVAARRQVLVTPREACQTPVMTQERPERPVVQEMVVVHGMFRYSLGRLPAQVRGVPVGDHDKADVLVDHVELGISALHHHHTAEDRYLWPVLMDRARPNRDVVERMEAQHEGLAALLERVQVQAAEFRYTASRDDGEQLASTLEALHVALDEHLADEEAHILPLVEQHLSVAEWDHLGQEAVKSLSMEQRVVMMGMLKESTSPQDADLLLHHAPVLVTKVGWPLVVRRQYEHYMRRLDEATSASG
jgi:iron-sulfur cluster repair protein YtfE (RIC family)